jgi:hypothetical protein
VTDDHDTRFDFSDVEDTLTDAPLLHDRLDAVLDIAVTVLADYAPDFGNTRLERMARYLMLNLGGEPTLEKAGALARFSGDEVEVLRAGEHIAVHVDGLRAGRTPEQARALAVMLLRAAELAES